MKVRILFSFLLLGLTSFTAHAQESKPDSYDLALLKREYVGKNEIFVITIRNEAGKINRMDGYIRASASSEHVTIYTYNIANRNYDLIEIRISDIVSIVKSESQKFLIVEKPRTFTAGNIFKAAGVVVIAGALALLIFHDKL